MLSEFEVGDRVRFGRAQGEKTLGLGRDMNNLEWRFKVGYPYGPNELIVTATYGHGDMTVEFEIDDADPEGKTIGKDPRFPKEVVAKAVQLREMALDPPA